MKGLVYLVVSAYHHNNTPVITNEKGGWFAADDLHPTRAVWKSRKEKCIIKMIGVYDSHYGLAMHIYMDIAGP